MSETTFFRLLHHDDKAAALRAAVAALNQQQPPADTYTVDPASFAQVPGSPFAYWVDEETRNTFQKFEMFESDNRAARIGMGTLDNFRFVRSSWEVSPHQILTGSYKKNRNDFLNLTFSNQRWITYYKGGAFSRYYSDLHLLVNFGFNGSEVKAFVEAKVGSASRKVQAEDFYFRSGVSWSRRSQIGMSVRVLPAGCIFADTGPSILASRNLLPHLLGLLNSIAFQNLVEIQIGFGSYEVGVIQRTPVPDLDNPNGEKLGTLALACVNLKRNLDTATETSHVFQLPALLQASGDTLAARGAAWAQRVAEAEQQLAAHQREIDDIAFRLYGIEGDDRAAIEAGAGQASTSDEERDEDDDAPAAASQPLPDLVADLVSYMVGCLYGRWDTRYASGEQQFAPLPDPFAPLPVAAPGMFPPEEHSSSDHPAILVDDPGHPDDIITHLRDLLPLLFGNRADAIERELYETLAGGYDLRPWFRATFFEQHIKRYSKSRRKAPIYWCLSTPSRSYAVWLAYHRLTRDTLYRVLTGYVRPKLEFETRQLDKLYAEGGDTPSTSQRKAIEKQTAFVDELRDFRDELSRVAPLWRPDHNDGVIINYAPLWRLVGQPRTWQQECRKTWEALARGDYDWAHLALHLWPERVVHKCVSDRSLAIAHGLDAALWQQDEQEKWHPREVSDEELQALIDQHHSDAADAALAVLRDAPVPEPKKKRKAANKPRNTGGKRRTTQDTGQMRMELE